VAGLRYFFVFWVIIYCGPIFEIYRSRPIFGAPFLHSKSYAAVFIKTIILATFWAIFFTSSSGHPAKRSDVNSDISALSSVCVFYEDLLKSFAKKIGLSGINQTHFVEILKLNIFVFGRSLILCLI
jgi:hypothetical protein